MPPPRRLLGNRTASGVVKLHPEYDNYIRSANHFSPVAVMAARAWPAAADGLLEAQAMRRQEQARRGQLPNGWHGRDEALGLAMERIRDMVMGNGLPPLLAPLESVNTASPLREPLERRAWMPSAASEQSPHESSAGNTDLPQPNPSGPLPEEAQGARPSGEEPAWFTFSWSDYDEGTAQAAVTAGFGLLLLGLYLALHMRMLLLALLLGAIARSTNASLTEQLLQSQPQRRTLLRNTLLGVIPVLLFLLITEFPWLSMLAFQMRPVGETLWACFYLAAITDLLLVNSLIAFKSAAMCFFPWPPPSPWVTRFLVGTELLAQLYRQALPWPIWVAYLTAFPSSLATAAVVTYSLLKLLVFAVALAAARTQMASAATKGLGIGRPASAGEMAAAGDVCAICQDDLSSPLCLDCSHVFCQACITTWLEKKQTCPVCRGPVPKAAVSKWCRGGTFLQTQAF